MRALLILGAVSVLGLFVGLGSVDFSDVREARDAAIARETWHRRDPIRPMLGGEPVLVKPWLAYVHEMAGAGLTGRSPVGSRLIRAMFAVLLVAATAWMGSRHLGARAGWAAAAVLATTVALPLAARADGVQVLATLLGWIAAWSFADVLIRGATPARLSLAYVALGTVFVIAGPLPALWPIAGLALGLCWSGAWSAWRRLHVVAGVLLIAGLALPWYGVMIDRFGAAFLRHAIAFPYADATPSRWYAAPARVLGFLVVGFFPWSTLLPEAALRAVRWPSFDFLALLPPADRPDQSVTVRIEPLLLGWLTASAIALPLLPAAPLTAALPALPAAALLVGRALDRVFAADPTWSRATVQAALLLGVTGTAGAVLLTVVAPRLTEAAPALRLIATFGLISSWAPFAAILLRRPAVAAALMALPVALGVPLIFSRTLPALEGYLSARQAADAFQVTAPPGTPLLVLGTPPASLRFHVRDHLIEPRDLARALRELRGNDGYAYVAFPVGRETEVARAASPAAIEILIRGPSLGLARVQELR